MSLRSLLSRDAICRGRDATCRALVLVLALVLASVPARAEWFIFRETRGAPFGYIHAPPGQPGFGYILLGGYPCPVTDFGSRRFSWYTDQPGFTCLIYHPWNLWVIGFIAWDGWSGRADILSTDGKRFEFDLTVLTVPEDGCLAP